MTRLGSEMGSDTLTQPTNTDVSRRFILPGALHASKRNPPRTQDFRPTEAANDAQRTATGCRANHKPAAGWVASWVATPAPGWVAGSEATS
jgi:hypothetical protein